MLEEDKKLLKKRLITVAIIIFFFDIGGAYMAPIFLMSFSVGIFIFAINYIFLWIIAYLFLIVYWLNINTNNEILDKLAKNNNLEINSSHKSFIDGRKINSIIGHYKEYPISVTSEIYKRWVLMFFSWYYKTLYLGDRSIKIQLDIKNNIRDDFFVFKDWRGKISYKRRMGGMQLPNKTELRKKFHDLENEIKNSKGTYFSFSNDCSYVHTKEKDPQVITKYLDLLIQLSKRLQ